MNTAPPIAMCADTSSTTAVHYALHLAASSSRTKFDATMASMMLLSLMLSSCDWVFIKIWPQQSCGRECTVDLFDGPFEKMVKNKAVVIAEVTFSASFSPAM